MQGNWIQILRCTQDTTITLLEMKRHTIIFTTTLMIILKLGQTKIQKSSSKRLRSMKKYEIHNCCYFYLRTLGSIERVTDALQF